MIPRSYLVLLLASLAILLVTFPVVMAGFGLASGMGDAGAAAVLWYLGMTNLALLAIVLILLICTLALVVAYQRHDVEEEVDEE